MDKSPKRSARCLPVHYSSISLFDSCIQQKLHRLSVATCNPNTNEEKAIQEPETEKASESPNSIERKPVVADCMTCSCCQAQFTDREEQLYHYKCDWHRYNLYCRLKGLPCVTEEEFEEVAGDVSSISGSDNESEDDSVKRGIPVAETPDIINNSSERTIPERKFHKVFFRTEEGELISVCRCLLHHKKNPQNDSDSLLAAVNEVWKRGKWIILMVSAGHFAGAVFSGKVVTEHKTFHRYTVRAKRGTAQSNKDGQGGAPKSAGANLRRYNEAALIQEVQELLTSWAEHLRSSDYIFIRTPVAGKVMFYGGKIPALRKDDPRIRVIPFPTRRPTFNETKRVHQMLSSVESYGLEVEVGDIIPMSPQRVYNPETGQLEVKRGSPKPERAGNKKQSLHQLEKRTKINNTTDGNIARNPIEVSSDDEAEAGDVELVETLQTIDLRELKEFDCTTSRKPKKKKQTFTADKEDIAVMNVETDNDVWTVAWRNSMFTACKTGNLELLDNLIKEICECHLASSASLPAEISHEEISSEESRKENSDANGVNHFSLTTLSTAPKSCNEAKTTETHYTTCRVHRAFNQPLVEDGSTVLHIAAREAHHAVATLLLHAGADPALKDKSGKLPYYLGDVEVRNAMRRFMASFPNRYDYAKAQIPSPLTAEMETEKKCKAAEKRKAKKKASQKKNKEKKAAEATLREENVERERFLALSDREKRALAAERRILQQHSEQGTSKPVLRRCWQCGTDITGKVPFEYSDFKFCTTKCLREHRAKS